ncbi:MAG: hypothetical protein WA890_09740, partial [Micromonospora sp.]
ELASAAARSLRDEAYEATGRAPEAQSLLSTLDMAGAATETARDTVAAREAPSVARGRAAVPAY